MLALYLYLYEPLIVAVIPSLRFAIVNREANH